MGQGTMAHNVFKAAANYSSTVSERKEARMKTLARLSSHAHFVQLRFSSFAPDVDFPFDCVVHGQV